MTNDMKYYLSVFILWVLGWMFFEQIHVRLFCAFAAGVNFEAYLVAWRMKNNEPPL